MLENKIESLMQEKLEMAISYAEFKALVSRLISEGKSTGHTQSDEYLNYSKLSERRMKRWDKVFKFTEEDKVFLQEWSRPITFLTISEGWCGDAAHALPILNKITEASEHLTLKIVLRDDNEELMDEFLTNGGRAIPKLIALNEDLEVLFTWGPRPTTATQLVNEYKELHGKLTPEFKEDLQKWYNKDKGQTIVKDIIAKLSLL
jgi:hypothetical protein